MTSFGGVNVGDKVRLTDSDGEEHVIRVYAIAPTVGDGWAITGNHGTYHSSNWSVEVLEPAPKPLPTREPGYYTAGHSGLYHLDEEGVWRNVVNGYSREHGISDRYVRTFERLVPSTAVEEARAEVVKEIVAHLRWFRDNSADEIESKFGGGKA